MGYYEYTTLRAPGNPPDKNFSAWLKKMYIDCKWELVCPVNCYVSGGNSRDDYLYIFRRWVEETTPHGTML